jgi:flagellar biosynthetic protein FliQ
MTSAQVVEVVRGALMTAFLLALPLLAIGFVAGIVISLTQVLTSIQDTAVNSVPRLLIFLAAILLLLPWMVNRSTSYTADLITNIGRYAH